jgi:hypothetical protein
MRRDRKKPIAEMARAEAASAPQVMRVTSFTTASTWAMSSRISTLQPRPG